QGHDGSLTVAFNDYRDDIILEFEKRIYNNIKVSYDSSLFDINKVLPGAFRDNQFKYWEVMEFVYRDFLKWKSTYTVEFEKNTLWDVNNHKTYNYGTILGPLDENLPGHWRAIFKLYFDTDRPHLCPWEMLGFSNRPDWWEETYGPAPYTSGNLLMWEDIAEGRIVQGDRQGLNSLYARPGLLDMLPVDDEGNLVDMRNWHIIGQTDAIQDSDASWKFGDHGPAETTWRRSSYWPYAVQIILALAKPALYSSLMYDTSRVNRDKIGNIVYSEDGLFLSTRRLLVPYDVVDSNKILSTGYSIFLVEAGLQRTLDYISNLKNDLQFSNFHLMHKVGGFISKDKIEVVIDSVNPNSISPGVLLPLEDYSIFFNIGNTVKTVAASGIIIQKYNNQYIVRGYDRVNPYFTVYDPIHQKFDRTLTVGGKSEDYSLWSANYFYSAGDIVLYQNQFFRVISNHDSGSTFTSKYYSSLATLPTIGGTTAAISDVFETEIRKVSYGTILS
ncbi:hypothetical protein EBU71_18915, partial [bacterium]|nr:hypothetical protein [Candidatus Elulimicrobium humile]